MNTGDPLQISSQLTVQSLETLRLIRQAMIVRFASRKLARYEVCVWPVSSSHRVRIHPLETSFGSHFHMQRRGFIRYEHPTEHIPESRCGGPLVGLTAGAVVALAYHGRVTIGRCVLGRVQIRAEDAVGVLRSTREPCGTWVCGCGIRTTDLRATDRTTNRTTRITAARRSVLVLTARRLGLER